MRVTSVDSVDIMFKFGRTALHNAVRENSRTEVLKILDDNKELLNTKDSHGFSPLYTASLFGFDEIMKDLIMNGADINSSDLGGLSCLHIASEKGHPKATELLLNHGAKQL